MLQHITTTLVSYLIFKSTYLQGFVLKNYKYTIKQNNNYLYVIKWLFFTINIIFDNIH